MSASDEAARRHAMRLEDERARPVPPADRVIACDYRDLAELLGWLRGSPARLQEMTTDAFRAAQQLAASAGIPFP